MPLKTHHKVLIGGFSTLVILFMIINSIFLYLLFTKINLVQQATASQLIEFKADTQSKMNDLSNSFLSRVEQNQKETELQLEKLKATASTDFSSVIENSLGSVLTIRTDVSQGTGFLISDNGYFVTNAHVIEGARYAEAITSDQKTLRATLIGGNSDYDVALLKIDGNFNALPLADSDTITIGEKVIAIGNPLGLQFSASEGIVSGVHRQTPTSPGYYLQTDAALNPGNSGGPLIDKEGEVVGINNFKVGGYEGLGFALESNDVKKVINALFTEKNISLTIP